MTRGALPVLALAAAMLFAGSAAAQDTLKIAVGQINNWENQPPTLGQDVGIFKKHNLILENFGTAGAGETIQAVVSGAADIGIGVGVAGAMRAYLQGAPIRILTPSFTGTGDLYWYVKADSPLKTLKDATDKMTIAYSTSGSSSHNQVIAFVDELGCKAKPTATGSPPATLTSVLTGQIDIGWAAPPFGLKEIKEGKIRLLVRGSEIESLNKQTARATIVNLASLQSKHDAVMRFVDGYREAVDWMYSDPQAITMYAKKIGASEDLLKESIAQFHPKTALQSDTMADMPGIIRDAVRLKYIAAPPTEAQLKEFVQTPPRK